MASDCERALWSYFPPHFVKNISRRFILKPEARSIIIMYGIYFYCSILLFWLLIFRGFSNNFGV